ncbi:hypothetical protein DL546_008052 [Coniochaeta pulveracea]|uniref:J domain-containing protein n=1 Tax=Coniochaeta pulveracea TaxID=177199 RepID=A0A420YEG7_9PEZI|nr:hypothetical protein DL546_008052 [Coniochaeta pulveracea]
MRFSTLSIGLLAVLTPLAAAWSKEDREIFRVRDELTLHEGPDVTFYEFLGIKPSASQDEINKAYRKKSRSLHPDKVKQQLAAERAKAAKEAAKKSKKGVHVTKPPTQAEIKAAVKRASDRQARLSIVTNILRGPGRERYDYFMANGFPTWKGTEYYYSRYRPGFGTVITGLFLFAGGVAHYIALYMGWKRQREFVERYIKYARNAAWGENLGLNIPGVDGQPAPAPAPAAAPRQMYEDEQGRQMPVNRKMRRMQERDAKKEAAKEAGAGSGRKGRRAAASAAASASASGSATPQPQAAGAGPTGAKKRVVAENGKVLVVDSLGDVYLEQDDEDGNTQEFLLDPNELPRPTIKDTALVRLPLFIYSQTVGRVISKRQTEEDLEFEEEQEEIVDDQESSESGKRTPSTTDSAEDYEILDKSVELEADKAKTTGASQKQANKRKNKKR